MEGGVEYKEMDRNEKVRGIWERKKEKIKGWIGYSGQDWKDRQTNNRYLQGIVKTRHDPCDPPAFTCPEKVTRPREPLLSSDL